MMDIDVRPFPPLIKNSAKKLTSQRSVLQCVIQMNLEAK